MNAALASAPVAGVLSLWLGTDSPREAVAAFRRARSAGMSSVRALVVGQIGSFRDCWAFRSKLARAVGCSVRTVQRAITQAKSLGLIGVARAKPHEKPPGCSHPVECGFSHRWTIGWGKTGEAVKAAVAAARLRFVARSSVAATVARGPSTAFSLRGASEKKQSTGRVRLSPQRWTAEALDRELERIAAERAKQRDGPT